jgi:hypothetical protein
MCTLWSLDVKVEKNMAPTHVLGTDKLNDLIKAKIREPVTTI